MRRFQPFHLDCKQETHQAKPIEAVPTMRLFSRAFTWVSEGIRSVAALAAQNTCAITRRYGIWLSMMNVLCGASAGEFPD